MQKRVGIARAIAMNPKYLFCDEPNSGLDPQTAIVIDNLIGDLTREFNMTTVVVSHDMNSVMEASDFIHFRPPRPNRLARPHLRPVEHANISEALNEFIFASKIMRELRKTLSSQTSPRPTRARERFHSLHALPRLKPGGDGGPELGVLPGDGHARRSARIFSTSPFRWRRCETASTRRAPPRPARTSSRGRFVW